MKWKKWVLIYGIGLTAFTIYITLDTFVISSAYNTNATEINTAVFDNVKKKSLKEDAENNSSNMKSTDEDSASDESKNLNSTTEADNAAESDTTSHKFGEHSKDGKGKHRPGDRERIKNAKDSESSDDAVQSRKEDSDTTEQSSKGDNDTTEQSNKESNNSSVRSAVTETASEQTYKDDNIDITLKTYDYNDTKVYVADIQLSSAEFLKTAFADDTYGKNITAKTSEIAEEHNAILAINGDYYGVQESGYVIRNGVVYRDIADDEEILCIYADGTFKTVNSSEVAAADLVTQGVWQAFSFGPSLIENGSIAVSTDDEVGKAMASNPRTAIGQISDLHYVFVVSDGRTEESEGLSLYELASFMDTLGVETAYNLDGGGSSSMVFRGTVVNKPTSSGNSIKERGVSDIVYIG